MRYCIFIGPLIYCFLLTQLAVVGAEADPIQNVLWNQPADVKSEDLVGGIGGKAGAPDPSGIYTNTKEQSSGIFTKVLTDDQGRTWLISTQNEVRAEVASTRLVFSAGYMADREYYLPALTIQHPKFRRVLNVGLRRIDSGSTALGEWSWAGHPFSGSQEIQGLKILNVLLNNWDYSQARNLIVSENVGQARDYYLSGWNQSLGKLRVVATTTVYWANHKKHRRTSQHLEETTADPKGFANSPFILGARNGQVLFALAGHLPNLDGVSVDSAHWMGTLLNQLSDKQLGDAFSSGGFNSKDTYIYVVAIKKRIQELLMVK